MVYVSLSVFMWDKPPVSSTDSSSIDALCLTPLWRGVFFSGEQTAGNNNRHCCCSSKTTARRGRRGMPSIQSKDYAWTHVQTTSCSIRSALCACLPAAFSFSGIQLCFFHFPTGQTQKSSGWRDGGGCCYLYMYIPRLFFARSQQREREVEGRERDAGRQTGN